MFILTSLIFNRYLFVKFALNHSPYHLCETNKDCLSSQHALGWHKFFYSKCSPMK